jgi:hypothetical protein
MWLNFHTITCPQTDSIIQDMLLINQVCKMVVSVQMLKYLSISVYLIRNIIRPAPKCWSCVAAIYLTYRFWS